MNIYDLSLLDLKKWLKENDGKSFQAEQIYRWIYKQKVSSWEEMRNINKNLLQKLSENFSLSSLNLVQQQCSKDEQTSKFLWQLKDGKNIESVLIESGLRRTVCVSAQVGCAVGCRFCASGKNGLFRNLTTSEIIEQIVAIDKILESKGENVSHVVFMGMGEPLHNYDNVINAIRILIEEKGLNISQRRITVSTVGIIDKIYKLAEENLKVNLVLSLHAANQKTREKLIPIAHKYPLAELIKAMQNYFNVTKRDITSEYTMLDGINDSVIDANMLVGIIGSRHCTLNIIPYNEVDSADKFKKPSHQNIQEFREALDRNNITNTCRYTKGDDIAAACGQLANQN